MGKSARFKGGVIDAALDAARARSGGGCFLTGSVDVLVILRSTTTTRRLVVNLGGCPRVILRNGRERLFTLRGIKQVEAVLPRIT
jgi:hypothetical protein